MGGPKSGIRRRGPWTDLYSGPWTRSVGGSADKRSVFSDHPFDKLQVARNF